MKLAPVSLAVLATALATPAMAADEQESSGGIEQIVVTAQKRAENVQDVPIAISAFTAGALQERAVTSVASLSNIAPNVTLDAGTPFSGSSQVWASISTASISPARSARTRICPMLTVSKC